MIACPIFLHVSQGFKLRPPCLCGIYPESPVSPKAFYLEKVDLKPLLFRSCDRWNFVEKTLKKVSLLIQRTQRLSPSLAAPSGRDPVTSRTGERAIDMSLQMDESRTGSPSNYVCLTLMRRDRRRRLFTLPVSF